MFNLLDQVQKHHREMVRHTVAKGYELWVHGKVTAQERLNINKLWSEVSNPVPDPKFQYDSKINSLHGMVDMPAGCSTHLHEEGNANMARLLSRPQGRKLVDHLYKRATSDMPVLIKVDQVNMLGDPDDPQHPFNPSLSPSALTSNTPAQELHLKTSRQRQGVKTIPGSGVQFGLKMLLGTKDSDFSDYNQRGKRIPSPGFVGFGHELTHGAHYMSGTYLPGAQMIDLPKNYKGDVEEFLTIAPKRMLESFARSKITKQDMHFQDRETTSKATFDFSEMLEHNKNIPNEADIRAEHGLPLRHGHTSSLTPETHPGAHGGDEELRTVGWKYITNPRRIAKKIYADVKDETPEQLRARQTAAAARQAAAARPLWKRVLGLN